MRKSYKPYCNKPTSGCLQGVLGDTRCLSEQVVHGCIGNTLRDNVQAEGIVAKELMLERIPSLATIFSLHKPGLGGNSLQLSSNSPSHGGSGPTDIQQAKANISLVGGVESTVPRGTSVFSAPDTSALEWRISRLSDSAAMVNRGTVNAVEVERSVDAEERLPGLASVGGLGQLGLVAVVITNLGRTGTLLQADATIITVVNSAASGVVVAREFTSGNVPDIVGWEGSITSLSEENIAGQGLEQTTAINSDSNTLLTTVGSSNAEFLTAITIFAEVTHRLAQATAQGWVESLAVIVRVEFAEDSRNNSGRVSHAKGQKQSISTKVSLSVVPSLATVHSFHNLRANTVGVTSDKAFISVTEPDTQVSAQDILGHDSPVIRSNDGYESNSNSSNLKHAFVQICEPN
eukprot:m.104608 g.104608  ORF g.104608 m.104608 type:complete len:404 (-) comp15254_c0_seq4:44-1255(-)